MTANYLKCSGPKTVTGKKVFQTGKVQYLQTSFLTNVCAMQTYTDVLMPFAMIMIIL